LAEHVHNHEPEPQETKKNKILLTAEEFQTLQDKAKKSEEYFDRFLRLQADFDNYKKRLEKEKVEFIKFANEEIITEILKIIDDFERAVEAGKIKHDFDILYKGIEMIHKDFKEFLKQKGLKEIETKGKPFNPHEHEAIEVVEDEETIKGFAHDVGQSVYHGPASDSLLQANVAVFNCYRDSEQIADFHMISGLIQTSDGDAFKFKSERTDWRKMRPQVWAMERRVSCRSNIRYIHSYITHLHDDKTYPASETWCDAIRKSLVAMGRATEDIGNVFKCPGARRGDSSYAINPNCRRDSPGDTVLLFEAKAGWNQHGGPELFTFDNHVPKGGFVVLNDGTVKFLGTEEELKQLRWE